MKQIVTTGIILARTDYGEADRILTLLTTDQGKVRVLAKGVRRIKSKLAGGIELFSVSDVTYIPGRGELGTLISARMREHYGKISQDIGRTMLAYELLKRLHRATEDAAGPEYFKLLVSSLEGLHNWLPNNLVELWFDAHLLLLAGHQPNLTTNSQGRKLTGDQLYQFDPVSMAFNPSDRGSYRPDHIKFLRLVFSVSQPAILQQVNTLTEILPPCQQLITTLRQQFIQK